MHIEFPPWWGELHPLYWQLRMVRPWDTAHQHRLYRKIRKIKKRLLAAGVPYIELHLVTRVMRDPRNNNYRMRLANYQKQLTIWTMPTS